MKVITYPRPTYLLVAHRSSFSTWVGVTKSFFSVLLFSQFFQSYLNTAYLYTIMFLSDKCNCSWAAKTPDKYKCNLMYLTDIFCKIKKKSCDKRIDEWSFSNPHPRNVSKADSRLAPSQWDMSLQNNGISHWLGANPESALCKYRCNLAMFVFSEYTNHI